MPVVAKSYYYRMLAVTHTSMGLRNSRELLTLSVILDFLALQQPMRAADVVAQRLKAVEQSVVDGQWDRAQFLELLEGAGTTLVNKSEEMLLVKEQETRARIRARIWKGSSGSGGYSTWQRDGGKDPPFGKGKGKGKGKNKGKNKDKNNYGSDG